MKKPLIFILALFLAASAAAEEMKKADFADKWYPADPKRLASMLESYIENVEWNYIPPGIIAAIIPHGAYIYSGPIAAYAFKTISKLDVETVVIVGFNHNLAYDGIAVYKKGAFETPFGPLKIDEELAEELIMSSKRIFYEPAFFKNEHSVEMELPFIKYIYDKKEIKIVPVALGVQSFENAEILGEGLYRVLKDRDKFLLIASSDFSHNHSYNEAIAVDNLTIEAIKKFNPKDLYNETSLGKGEGCGIGAVVATMIAARKLGADKVKILKYANSGDTAGRRDSVVGYLSAVMYKSIPERKD